MVLALLCFDDGDDFALVGEASFGLLAVDELLISNNIEDAARETLELGLDAERGFQFCRQTGGAGLEISHSAVLDLDVHWSPLAGFSTSRPVPAERLCRGGRS